MCPKTRKIYRRFIQTTLRRKGGSVEDIFVKIVAKGFADGFANCFANGFAHGSAAGFANGVGY